MKNKISRMSKKDIGLIILLASLLLPVIAGCFFAVPTTDDFDKLLWTKESGNYLTFLIQRIVFYYTQWQGTYFAVVCTAFPVFRYFGLTGYRMAIFLDTVLFFLIVFVLVRSFVQYIGVQRAQVRTSVLAILAVALGYLLGTNHLSEVFYWYTGAQSYVIPICCLLFSVVCYMRYEITSKMSYVAIGSILAFLASGGMLNVAALQCSLFLMISVIHFFVSKKVSRGSIIGGFALIGALINALAPGNFVRREQLDASAGLIRSFVNTFYRMGHTMFVDFRGGLLLLLFVLMFLLGFRMLKESAYIFKYPGWVTLYAFFAVFITDFPVVYGYGGTDIAVRGAFVEHLAITIYIVFIAVYWGGWVAQNEVFEISKATYVLLAMMMVLYLSGPYAYNTVFNFIPYKMAAHMLNGDFARVSEREVNMIEQVANSPEEDVIVYTQRDPDGEWTNIQRQLLSEDSSFCHNTPIASFYKKKSVAIRYTD